MLLETDPREDLSEELFSFLQLFGPLHGVVFGNWQLDVIWGQFQVSNNVIKVMKITGIIFGHFSFQLEDSPDDSIQSVLHYSTFLRMNHLIITLLESAKDLDVSYIHCCEKLEEGVSILYRQ